MSDRTAGLPGLLTWSVVSGAELRNVRADGALALDGLYFAVRDQTWGTIPGRLLSTREETDGAERREYSEWIFQSDSVQLRTTLLLTAETNQLSLEATSVAVGPQSVRRVGMCLLHPLELRGARVVLHHEDGSADRSTFPPDISPHQPFLGLVGLTERLPGGASLEIRFEGGVFETEDHRNWTDAGWKTYSPPLAAPSPIRLADGDVLTQRVTLTAVPAPQPGEHQPPVDSSGILISIGAPTGAVSPRLGTGVSGRPSPASAAAGCSFLLCELQDDADGVSRLDAAVAEARHNRLPLSVLLSCSAARLGEWARLLRAHSADIDGVTVVDPESRVTPSGTAERLRSLLEGTSIRVGAGTRGYGAEFGRARERFTDADFVQLSASAMVHHADDERVADTVRAYPDLIRLARSRAGQAPLLIGPITIAERLTLHGAPTGPYAPYDAGFPADPRTSAPFGAAWAVGVVAGAVGADALSFFWSGPDGGFGSENDPSPVAAVIGRLGQRAGQTVLEATNSDPRSIAAVAWRDSEGRSTACLANLTDEPQLVRVAGNSHRLDPYGVVDVALES